MHHQEIEPPEELRSAINCFWYARIEFGEVPSNYDILPDGYAEIVFHFSSQCSILINGATQPLPSPFIMGLLNQPVVLSATGSLEVIGIKCYPWTVFDLLGLSSGKDGLRTFEHPVAQLQTALGELIHAGNIEKALALVKDYFVSARPGTATDSLLQKAGVALRQANGTISVSKVAAAAHATVRTLERKFKQSSGYSVKDVSGLMRFEQTSNHLWRHPDASLAGLAQELGYTDQAHLSREFKRYSGTTPAAFARKVRREKETVGNDFVVFIQA